MLPLALRSNATLELLQRMSYSVWKLVAKKQDSDMIRIEIPQGAVLLIETGREQLLVVYYYITHNQEFAEYDMVFDIDDEQLILSHIKNDSGYMDQWHNEHDDRLYCTILLLDCFLPQIKNDSDMN